MTPPLRADGSPLSDVVTYIPIDACPLFAPPFDWNGGGFLCVIRCRPAFYHGAGKRNALCRLENEILY